MKKHITIVGVFVALVIGFGYYTLFSSPASDTSDQLAKDQSELAVEGNTNEGEKAQPQQGVGSLESLMLLRQDLECVIRYKHPEQQTEIEGTYFVHNGKIRGDFLTESPDLSGQILSSMIIEGEKVYLWSEIDGNKYGMKIALNDMLDSESKTNEPVPLNEDVDYDCKPWENVDNTVFLPPADVLFRDLNEVINTGMEYGNVYEEGELPF